DLRGLGTWRLELCGLGGYRDRVRAWRLARRWDMVWADRDGRRDARVSQGLGDFYIQAGGYRGLGPQRVVVLSQVFGRGKTSRLELGQFRPRGANLFHLRGGKVTRLVAYFDRHRALADLGLDPEGAARDQR